MKSEALSGGNWIPGLLFETPSESICYPNPWPIIPPIEVTFCLSVGWMIFRGALLKNSAVKSIQYTWNKLFPLTQEGFIRRCDSWKVLRKYLPTMILTKCVTSPQDTATVLVRVQLRWALSLCEYVEACKSCRIRSGIKPYVNLDWTQLIGWSCHVSQQGKKKHLMNSNSPKLYPAGIVLKVWDRIYYSS